MRETRTEPTAPPVDAGMADTRPATKAATPEADDAQPAGPPEMSSEKDTAAAPVVGVAVPEDVPELVAVDERVPVDELSAGGVWGAAGRGGRRGGWGGEGE